MMFDEHLDASMLDVGDEEKKEKEAVREEMRKLYAASIKDIQVGKVIEGTVIDISKDYVLVDIGFKSEGAISLDEFTNKKDIKVGDKIQVFLQSKEDKDGVVVLSKLKADKLSQWEETIALCKENKVVKGRVTRKVKGGLMVDIGLEAFLPASHVDLRHVKNLESYFGRELELRVIKINPERRNIVVSRRVLLEETRKKLREKVLSTIKVGDVVEGTVKNITDFGAFIDLNGIDGLLHITDMRWGRVSHPSEVLAVGDRTSVKVLDFDKDRERISLGLKQMTPNPWDTVEEKYPVSSRLKGRVVNIVPYGAFIELEKGVEGLVHISELSWTRKINHPSEVLGIGDMVEAVVLSIDRSAQKISLGLRQTEVNPWSVVEEKYPVGTVVKGKVRNIVPYGAFVELEEGLEALLHISDLSWTRKVNHPSEILKRGEMIDTKVLSVDPENRKIALGIKQLQPNPWEDIGGKYAVGDTVSGTITNITGFGLFVELGDGIEGLVHISQIAKRPEEDIKSVHKVGEKVTAKVLRIDPSERKIGLSITEHLEGPARADFDGASAREERVAKADTGLDNPVLGDDVWIDGLDGEAGK